MQKIVLNNGETRDVAYCGVADGMLFFEIAGAGESVLDAARLFSDAENTRRIVYQMEDLTPVVYERYTRLMGVSKDRYLGHIAVRLIREVE